MPPFLGSTFGGPGSTPESVRPIADRHRALILSPPPGTTDLLERMALDGAKPGPARDRLLGYALASDRGVAANAFHGLIVTDLRRKLAFERDVDRGGRRTTSPHSEAASGTCGAVANSHGFARSLTGFRRRCAAARARSEPIPSLTRSR